MPSVSVKNYYKKGKLLIVQQKKEQLLNGFPKKKLFKPNLTHWAVLAILC